MPRRGTSALGAIDAIGLAPGTRPSPWEPLMASVGESGPLPENVAEIPSEPEDLVDICAKLVCSASTGTHIRSEE